MSIIGSGTVDWGHRSAKLAKIRGKTIRGVEFGEAKQGSDVHRSEALILRFEDGSALALRIGSNVGNLADKFEKLKPEDLYVNFVPIFAPAVDQKD